MVLTISSILENINNWLAALGSVCVFAWRTIKALWVVEIAWCPQQMALGWLRNPLTCQWSAAHATSRSSGDPPNLCLVCRERCVYEHLWLLWSFVEWQWGWFERKILESFATSSISCVLSVCSPPPSAGGWLALLTTFRWSNSADAFHCHLWEGMQAQAKDSFLSLWRRGISPPSCYLRLSWRQLMCPDLFVS